MAQRIVLQIPLNIFCAMTRVEQVGGEGDNEDDEWRKDLTQTNQVAVIPLSGYQDVSLGQL